MALSLGQLFAWLRGIWDQANPLARLCVSLTGCVVVSCGEGAQPLKWSFSAASLALRYLGYYQSFRALVVRVQ